jgi:hypothetical protein
MSKITLTNVGTATVSLFFPNIKWSRELTPGRAVPVSQEDYEEMTFDPGFMALVNGHFIKVEGIAEDEQVEEVGTVVSAAEIAAMFDENNVTGFAKFIPNATAAEKETVVKLAVDKGITSPAFTMLIKKYCDVDVINAINMKHQAEEK